MNAASQKRERPAKRLLSIKETAQYLGHSEWTVREMLWAGKIPSVRFNRKIMVDIEDLDRLIEDSKSVGA